MAEQMTGPQTEISQKIDYGSKIQAILTDPNPLQKLHETASTVKYFLDSDTAISLKADLDDPKKKNPATYQLLYRCLPTLDAVIQPMTGLGVDNQELIAFGFTKSFELIKSWTPKDTKDHNSYLREYIGRELPKKFQDYIASVYNLPARLFPLISLYFSAKNEFYSSYDRDPNLNEWSTIKNIIEDKIKQLSPEEENKIKKLSHSISKYLLIIHQINASSINYHRELESQSDHYSVVPKEKVMQTLEGLTDKQKKILIDRLGLESGAESNLENVAKNSRTSKKSASNLFNNALREIWQDKKTPDLKPFLEDL